MKRLFILISIVVISIFVVSPSTTQAHMGSMMETDNNETQTDSDQNHSHSIEAVIQSILDKQNVSTIQELDLSKLSDDDWEELGDAVMEAQHPGEAHEVMDRMMGGEGSESLREMHIRMGQAFFGFGFDNKYNGPGMMGGGMMGYTNSPNYNLPAGMMGFGSMMGLGRFGNYGIFSAITWIFLIAFLASGIYFFINSSHRK